MGPTTYIHDGAFDRVEWEESDGHEKIRKK